MLQFSFVAAAYSLACSLAAKVNSGFFTADHRRTCGLGFMTVILSPQYVKMQLCDQNEAP
jgi:hypothetical protein